jgi:CTP:molybdopterin cytidylyltransferase MocA
MIAAIVLAAGAGSRFGGPKQRLFLPDVLAALTASPVDDIVVVAGAYDLEAPGAHIVRCAEWDLGPGASLRCGLASLSTACEAAVVCLADGPALAAAAVERVVGAWRETNAQLVAASYGGERGHPILIARPAWLRIPDEGARALPALLVPCDDLGFPGDVDTPDDLP